MCSPVPSFVLYEIIALAILCVYYFRDSRGIIKTMALQNEQWLNAFINSSSLAMCMISFIFTVFDCHLYD